MKKSFAFTLSFSVVFLSLLIVFTGTALAGPSTPATAVNPMLSTGIQPNAGVAIPPPSPVIGTLVLDISYQVKNDKDSGNIGYWALDNYTKDLKVWEISPGNFYAEAQYVGTWRTFNGALSPGLGMSQERDASGGMVGGYTATFTGALTNPGGLKLRGHIGSYDFGGTKADVLLGRYGNGQTGPTTPFAVLSAYFPGYANFAQPTWGWMYSFQPEGKDQMWMNFNSITVGDVLSWSLFR